MPSEGGFKRDLSEEELKELVHSGGKMAASMRQVLATVSERLAKLKEVNESLRARGPALGDEHRSAVTASLGAVAGSLNALQASLKLVGGSVSETAGALK
jgi:hypothetical protein